VVTSCVAMSGDVSGVGCLGASAERLRFRVLTFANTRLDHRIGAVALGEFERELVEVAWFAQLGERSPWDRGCVRISAWEQWPGPESARGMPAMWRR
jgi:hypothetical protein